MEIDPNDPSGQTKRKTPLYEEMELLTDDLSELTILMEKHQSEADAIHDNPQVMRARTLHSPTALAQTDISATLFFKI